MQNYNSRSKSFYFLFLLLIFTFWFVASYTEAAVKAFPSAEGFGADTVGGRGGRVIEVTNLNDSGAGSFRACAEATGPRICVFRISGTISLSSPIYIRAANSFLTVAGQTAPGGGVQLADFWEALTIRDGAHDIVIRYLKIRPGSRNMPSNMNDCNGITLFGTDIEVYNIIIDHVSVEWVCDDSTSMWGNVRDATFQWSLIAEGLDENDVSGANSKGFLGGGSAGLGKLMISLHHNLYAHIGSRVPLLKGFKIFDFRNNIIYNWGNNNGATYGGYQENHSAFGNVVNNRYIPGPNSDTMHLFLENGGPIKLDGSTADRGGTKIYTSGNWGINCPSGCSNDWDNKYWNEDYYRFNGSLDFPLATESQFRTVIPFSTPAIITAPTKDLEALLISRVGAIVPMRDALDVRLVNEFTTRTGDLGRDGAPYPNLSGGIPLSDTDHDGMPDSWESSHGLNPNNSSDGPAFASNGYTNVENYLNELSGDTVPGMVSQLLGDINQDRIVNSLDWSLMSAKWLTSDTSADLNKDGAVNSLDWSIMSLNWLKTI